MRRREFIALLGGTALASPLASRAQQQAIPTIGFLGSTSPAPAPRIDAFHSGLNESGYTIGQNVAIDIAGRTITTTDCLHSPPNWLAAK